MAVQNELDALLRPAIEALGYEFVGLEYVPNPKNRLVRIYIDRTPEGVTVDDCVEVSHEVSAVLELEDPVAGTYSLEVSSPGVDRPLFSLDQFRRFVGERAVVHLYTPLENRRKLDGVIVAVEEDRVALEIDGQIYRVGEQHIRRAHLKPDLQALIAGQ
ncbi:MAG: ribosome maturation factor RimP [Xanthomonadaceae bacterium]|nr:ribosome maturation factor RimP [Xanthomonadaceae bacterium]